MKVMVQVSDPSGWRAINTRRITPGMSEAEMAGVVLEITRLYDGWVVSDQFRDRHLRIHAEEV